MSTAGGCDEPQTEASEFRGKGKWDPDCQTCDYTNSPFLGVHALGTVRLGAPDRENSGLVAIRDPKGNAHPVAIVDHALVARTRRGDVSGQALIGWSLVVDDVDDDPAEVRITDFQAVPDWVTGSAVATYALDYAEGGERKSLCPGLSRDETTVTIVRGETYDEATKTVTPDQPDYATFACRGHALAKMRLMGRAPDDGYGSTWEDRQSTLKMLTADYCGSGESFTVLGQPLQWVDRLGLFPHQNVKAGRLEARWNLDGAQCLDTPRAVARQDVEAVCAIPRCAALPDDVDSDWLTFNP